MDAPSPRPHPLPEADAPGESRRAFLAQAAATAAVAWFWLDGVGDPLRRQRVEPTLPGAPRRSLDADEWRTLEAALERILPSEPGAPGARDVNAVGYVDAVLVEPGLDGEIPRRVRAFAGRLARYAKEGGQEGYERLPVEGQDAGIRLFEAVEVDEATLVDRRSLRVVISLALEALLGDPVHGGNVDAAGWKWTRHRPPFPRPTKPWRPPR